MALFPILIVGALLYAYQTDTPKGLNAPDELRNILEKLRSKIIMYKITAGNDFSDRLIALTLDRNDAISEFDNAYLEGDENYISLDKCKVTFTDIDALIENLLNDYEVEDLDEDFLLEELLIQDIDIYECEDDDWENEKYTDLKKQNQQKELLELEKYKHFKDEFIKSFKKKYKDYIHHEEKAGYAGASQYFIMVLDKNNNLVWNERKIISFATKKDDFTIDIDQSGNIKDRFHNKYIRDINVINRNDYAIIQIRVSDHEQNKNNINEMIDSTLSIAIVNDKCDPNSQEAFNGDCAPYDIYISEKDMPHIEYKMQYNKAESTDVDIINEYLELLDFDELIEER